MRASLHQISNGVLSNAPVNILHKQPPFQEKDRLSVSSRQPSTAAETQRNSSYRTGSGPTIWSGGEQNIDVPLHFIASQRHQPPSVSPQVRSSWSTHQHSTPFHHTKEELKRPADRREVFINHVEKLENICQMSIKARAMKQWESRAFEHLVKRRVFSVWFYSQRGELLMKKMWPVVQKQLLQRAMAHLIIHGKIHGFREQWRARRRRRALARWARRAARAGRAGRSRGPRRFRRRRLGRALRRWARAGRLTRGRRLAVEYYTKRRFSLALQKMKLLLLLRIKLSRFCTQKNAVEQKKTMSTLQRHAATRVMGQIRIARGKTHGTMRLTARGLKALSWHWKTKAHQDIFTMKAAVFHNEFAKRTVLHHLYRECQYAKKKRSNKVTHFASVRLILLRRAFSVMFMHHSHSSMGQRYLMQGAAKHHSLTAQFKYLRLWARPAQRRRQRRRRPRGAASDEGGPPPPPAAAAGARRALRRLRAAAQARAAGAAAGRFLEQKTKHITLAWLWQHTLLQRQLKKARLIANLRCVKSFFRRMKEGFHRNLLDAEAKQVATLKLLERFLCRMQKSASRTKHQILVYQEASEHFSFGWKRRALRRLAARPRRRRAAGRRRRRLLGRPFHAWQAAARNCILGGLQEREKRLYEVKIYFSRLRKRTIGSIHLRKCVLMGQRRKALGCWVNYTMKQSRQRTISQKAFRAWCVLNASKHMKKWQTFCKIKQKQRILLYRLQCHRLLRRLKQRVRSVQSQKVVVWRASVYSSQKSVSVCLRFWSTMVKQQVQLQDKIQILQTRQKRKSSIQSSLHQQISSSVHYNVATQLSQKTYFNSKDNAIITMDSSVAQLYLDHWKAFTYMSKQLAAMISALSRHRSAIGLRYAFLQWWFSATSASNQWGKVLDELKQQPINSMRAKRFYHSLISRRAFNQWKKSRRGIAGTGGGTSSTAKRKNSSSAKTARQGKGGPLPPKSTQPQGPSLHRAEEAAAGGPTTAECQRLGGGGGGGWRVALGAQQTLLPGSAAGKTSLVATASITNGDPQARLRRVGLMSEIVNDPPVSTTRLQPTKNIANKEAQYSSPVGEAVQPRSTAPPPKRLNFQPVPLATKENASVLETVDEETDDHGSTEGIGTRCDRPDVLAQGTVAPPDLDLLTDKQQNSRCNASGSVVKENNERYLIENTDVVIRLENVLNDEQRVVEEEKYIDKINMSAGAKVKRLDDESSIANFDVKRNESSLLSAVSGLSNIMFPGQGIADVTAIGIGECAIIEEKEHQTSSLLLQTPSTHANNVNLSPPAKSLQTAGKSTFPTHGYSSRPPPRPPQASTSLLHDPEAPPSYLFNFLKKKNSNRVKKMS